MCPALPECKRFQDRAEWGELKLRMSDDGKQVIMDAEEFERFYLRHVLGVHTLPDTVP